MIKLYNTLKKKKERITPIEPNHIKLYICGPTVYDKTHLGNARPYVIFDILFRLLKKNFKQVTYARNITDIDDKIIKAAKKNNISIDEITQKTIKIFLKNVKELKNLSPTIEPRATNHISEMVVMIQKLINKKYAYETKGHVLFNLQKYKNYGKLSKINLNETLAGARIKIKNYKKNAGDFILWKPSKYDQPRWKSPWGWGRPGWHIECSAMSQKYLGYTFDIHGGGKDLIFPHHENEIAQSIATNGINTFARTWIHCGIITVAGEKMSKSLGNFITIDNLLKNFSGEIIRYALLSTHYRQELNWINSRLEQAKSSLQKLYNSLSTIKFSQIKNLKHNKVLDLNLEKALNDDLNTPMALSILHTIAKQINKSNNDNDKLHYAQKLLINSQFMGLLTNINKEYDCQNTKLSHQVINKKILERNQAKTNKDFSTADRIRNELIKEKIILEDTDNGTIWKRNNSIN